MRALFLTKIFPPSEGSSRAPYNRHQFAALARRCEVDLIRLEPWFPGRNWFRPPPTELRSDVVDRVRVHHARALYAPKMGRSLSGALHAVSLLPRVARFRGKIDIVVGSFAYPDGWAAVALARLLRVPVVIKVHGTDVNNYGDDPWLRPLLRWEFSHAAAVVGPSQALVDRAIELGANAETSQMIQNGIDRLTFRVRDRAACRAELGCAPDEHSVLFIGRLQRTKGIDELMEAFARVAQSDRRACLTLIGDGEQTSRCKAFARERDLPVRFVGRVASETVAQWIGACDVVTLPSYAEGTPNVIVEALASGRRVVATDVGGIPHVVNDERLGVLVPKGSVVELADALQGALDRPYDPADVVAAGSFITWDESGAALHRVLSAACGIDASRERPEDARSTLEA